MKVIGLCVVLIALAGASANALFEEDQELQGLGHAGPVTFGVHHFASVQEFVGSGKRCGTPSMNSTEQAAVDAAVAGYIQDNGLGGGNLRSVAAADTPIAFTVPIYFHIITNTNGDGDIGHPTLKKQVRVLNRSFAKSGVAFSLAAVTRTANDIWYTMDQGSADEVDAKTALHVGGAEALNVYTNANAAATLGWSTLPSSYAFNPLFDGIFVHYASLPDGTYVPYNLGDTLTHEAGHWLGLDHTFAGGCSADKTNGGDRIADTHAEAFPSFSCDKSKDTCTGKGFGGKDPVTNFMDYAEDACMNRFTVDQGTRMQAVWGLYRQPTAIA